MKLSFYHIMNINLPRLHTAKPTVISVPSGTVELNIGSVFEIVCEPRGVPYPIISWRHQGRTDHQLPLTNNTRRLLVEVRDHEMAGRIECVATNGKGEATAGVDLLVLCKLSKRHQKPTNQKSIAYTLLFNIHFSI